MAVEPIPADGRIGFAYALKEELPLPAEGLIISTHPEGSHESCVGAECPSSVTVRLINVPEHRLDYGTALDSIDQALGHWYAIVGPDQRATQGEGLRTVATTQAPGPVEQALAAGWQLLATVHRAIAITSEVGVAPLAIERVIPTYLMLYGGEDGKLMVGGAVIVPHTFLPTYSTAEMAPLPTVRAMAELMRADHPMATYFDLRHAATVHAVTAGQYTEAVLTAASAAEYLIRTSAQAVVWALSLHPHSSSPLPVIDWTQVDPRALIGQVLSTVLKGNWSSQGTSHPVAVWRQDIAQVRTACIHFGHRASAVEAGAAMGALAKLESHIISRLRAGGPLVSEAASLLLVDGESHHAALSASAKFTVWRARVMEESSQ